jgi:hypothetical protein
MLAPNCTIFNPYLFVSTNDSQQQTSHNIAFQ